MFTGNGIFNIIAKYENALESRVVGLNKRIQVHEFRLRTVSQVATTLIELLILQKRFCSNKTDTVMIRETNIVTALCCHKLVGILLYLS